MADSSAQVVSYWTKGEVQNYTVTTDKFKLAGSDTTAREHMSYDVEVTVLDSTQNSYTVQWVYRNVKSNGTNNAAQKIVALSEGTKVIYKTDELGTFAEVVNWQEIRNTITAAAKELKKDFKHIPEMNGMIDQVIAMYTTKEGITQGGIKDIQQFHSFHGAKYILGEVLESKMQVANMFGGEPFNADVTVYLDEINEEDNNFIMRFTQAVDPKQLTAETIKYLKQMAKKMNVPAQNFDDLGELKNETTNGSRIHGSGWVIYSVQTTTVTSGDATNIEERVIEIKD